MKTYCDAGGLSATLRSHTPVESSSSLPFRCRNEIIENHEARTDRLRIVYGLAGRGKGQSTWKSADRLVGSTWPSVRIKVLQAGTIRETLAWEVKV